MRLSTSHILRLKQPYTTIIEHVEKEKITWFVWKMLALKMCTCTYIKISSWLTLTSAVPVSIRCRLINKRETGWLSVLWSLSNWFVLNELSKFIHEKCEPGILEAFKFWLKVSFSTFRKVVCFESITVVKLFKLCFQHVKSFMWYRYGQT